MPPPRYGYQLCHSQQHSTFKLMSLLPSLCIKCACSQPLHLLVKCRQVVPCFCTPCMLLTPALCAQAFTPQAVYLNGEQCQLTLTVDVTNVTPEIPLDTSAQIESSAVPISIRGTDLYGVDGNKLQLKGINWFGFELQVSCLAWGRQMRHAACRLSACTFAADLLHCIPAAPTRLPWHEQLQQASA